MPNAVHFSIAAPSDRHLLAMIRDYCEKTEQSFEPTSHIQVFGKINGPLAKTAAEAKKISQFVEDSDARTIEQLVVGFAHIIYIYIFTGQAYYLALASLPHVAPNILEAYTNTLARWR